MRLPTRRTRVERRASRLPSLLNDPEAAAILIEKRLALHPVVDAYRRDGGVLFLPLRKCSVDSAFARLIERRGRVTAVVQEHETTTRQRLEPKIELSNGVCVLV